jgi:hypothetical protein
MQRSKQLESDPRHKSATFTPTSKQNNRDCHRSGREQAVPLRPMEHAIRHSHFKAKIAEWLGIASSGGGPKRPSCRPRAAEKVVRYRHAQLSAIKLAGDINLKNYHPTAPLVAYLDEHLERRSDVWSCWKPLERRSDVWSRNLCERNFMRAEVDRGRCD